MSSCSSHSYCDTPKTNDHVEVMVNVAEQVISPICATFNSIQVQTVLLSATKIAIGQSAFDLRQQ